MARTRSSYYLHEELIFIILSYLPLSSLLRFSLVSKSWRSIILNQQFTDSHKKQAFLVMIEKDLDHVYVDTREKSVRLQLPQQCHSTFRWIGSCNGLVYLAFAYGDIIYLWNPSGNQLKKLLTPMLRGPCVRINMGFVFDSNTNDYKLLLITVSILHYDPIADDVIPVLEADLYSSNGDYWKKIYVPEIVRSLVICANSTFVHDPKTGVIYFEGIRELLSFDLRNEVFGVYPYPFPNSVQHSKSNVLDFEGSVAMIFETVADGILSLWTLDDVSGNKVSWTKKFNLAADLKIDWVVLYLGIGQFVAKNDDVGYVFYDYKKKDAKKFLSPAPSGEFNSVVVYNESLVSLI